MRRESLNSHLLQMKSAILRSQDWSALFLPLRRDRPTYEWRESVSVASPSFFLLGPIGTTHRPGNGGGGGGGTRGVFLFFFVSGTPTLLSSSSHARQKRHDNSSSSSVNSREIFLSLLVNALFFQATTQREEALLFA